MAKQLRTRIRPVKTPGRVESVIRTERLAILRTTGLVITIIGAIMTGLWIVIAFSQGEGSYAGVFAFPLALFGVPIMLIGGLFTLVMALALKKAREILG